MAIHNRRDMILLGIIICGVKSIHIIRKWFGISIFYYIKRYILIKGIILSGTHCINKMKKEVGMLLQKRPDTSAVGIYNLYEENTH